MKVIQAPNKVEWEDDTTSIFLAGSIEQDIAEDWQERTIELFEKKVSKKDHKNYTILNPRRDDWNDEWSQTFSNPQFYQQVQWELKGLNKSDWVLMYFDPNTTSPISLMELGMLKTEGNFRLVVVCPEGFYRKGNVDIFCDEYGITQKASLSQAVSHIIKLS